MDEALPDLAGYPRFPKPEPIPTAGAVSESCSSGAWRIEESLRQPPPRPYIVIVLL